MASGIYAIVNTTNSKAYVGSALNMEQRRTNHFSRLRRGVHPSAHLQAAFKKYGEAVFKFSVLEEVSDATALIPREQHWIDTLNPAYNKRLRAENNLGVKHPVEWCTALSRAAAARAETDEGAAHIAALAAHNKALWADPAYRASRIAAVKARWTPERRAQQSADSKARAAHLVDGVHFGTHRVWTEDEKLRAGVKLKEAWKSRAPVSEDDIRALVSAANPAWKAVELTGVRSQDKVLIHCEIHDHAQWQTVAKVRYARRGCKLCGYQRSSDVQVGRPKKSSETPERNLNHG